MMKKEMTINDVSGEVHGMCTLCSNIATNTPAVPPRRGYAPDPYIAVEEED